MRDCEAIKLKEEIHVNLGMRSSAKKLFENLDNGNSKIVMDFEGVGFMSQSFAQEYISQKLDCDIEIIEINMNEHVKKMFEIIYDRLEEAENKKRID